MCDDPLLTAAINLIRITETTESVEFESVFSQLRESKDENTDVRNLRTVFALMDDGGDWNALLDKTTTASVAKSRARKYLSQAKYGQTFLVIEQLYGKMIDTYSLSEFYDLLFDELPKTGLAYQKVSLIRQASDKEKEDRICADSFQSTFYSTFVEFVSENGRLQSVFWNGADKNASIDRCFDQLRRTGAANMKDFFALDCKLLEIVLKHLPQVSQVRIKKAAHNAHGIMKNSINYAAPKCAQHVCKK